MRSRAWGSKKYPKALTPAHHKQDDTPPAANGANAPLPPSGRKQADHPSSQKVSKGEKNDSIKTIILLPLTVALTTLLITYIAIVDISWNDKIRMTSPADCSPFIKPSIGS